MQISKNARAAALPNIRGRAVLALLAAGTTLALCMSAAPVLAQYESYGVFCASGRIEVDARSEEQMRSNRGACQFARFPTRSDAEGFARRNFGGIGGSCSCR
jgi:hypothetical protein